MWAQLQELETITVLWGLLSELGSRRGAIGKSQGGALLPRWWMSDQAACLRPLCAPLASLGTGLFQGLERESLFLLGDMRCFRN